MFRPERFLDDRDSVPKKEFVIPFSLGMKTFDLFSIFVCHDAGRNFSYANYANCTIFLIMRIIRS